MARITWGETSERFYELGVDRGVLYPKVGNGVPWNGLISVQEKSVGGDPSPYYYEGVKFLNVQSYPDFEATIEAFSSPKEFNKCVGIDQIANGLFATQQKRETFGFSYRTLIGNPIDAHNHAYKIHLVYNALAQDAERTNETISDSVNPTTLSWDCSTIPKRIYGHRPTAHLVIDSRITDPIVLTEIEDVLYGSVLGESSLPEPDSIIALFNP